MHTLSSWLKDNKKTQAQLAEAVGVSQSFLSLVLQGKRKPSTTTTIELEAITGIGREVLRPDVYLPHPIATPHPEEVLG